MARCTADLFNGALFITEILKHRLNNEGAIYHYSATLKSLYIITEKLGR
jgi:hypothetical protein